MAIQLSEQECRVIGVLMEKSVTTPEQYPLTVNGLTTGCNQKSNRNPVTSFSEETTRELIASLKAKRLVTFSTGFGSRVDKLSQRFCNTEFSDFKFSTRQFAIITELLLRGPQTHGELRSRCQRLASFDSADDVEKTMRSLLTWEPDPLIRPLPRESGKREVRYMHCFSEASGTVSPAPDALGDNRSNDDRRPTVATDIEMMKATIKALELRITALERQQNS